MKWSPTTLIVVAVIVVIGLYGGYRVIRHYNRIASQQTVNQQSPGPAAGNSQAATGSGMTVVLAEENKSGESGTATLSEANGKTTVTIALTGFTKDVVQPAHIHVGACPGVGAVKYPLTSVVNGSSVTELTATLADLSQNLPLAINVHKTAAEITSYTACGALSAGPASSQLSTASPVATPYVPPATVPQTKTSY